MTVLQGIIQLMRGEFAAVRFEDRAKAEATLAQLERHLAPALRVPLASLLGSSPDPDGALSLLERYTRGAPREALEELARTPTALTYLVAIFGSSGYLAETFLAEPGLAVQFARDRHFAKLKSKEDLMQDYARFSTTNPDPWLSSLLARFKRRSYLRLVLKDVLGFSTLGETTLELSTLADVILNNALLFCDQELEKRYGQPQYRDPKGRVVRAGFSIVSLGKLGGNELNYSSDLDLLFLYSHDGETAGGSERDSVIANKEYFGRLAHAITRTITQATPQGRVFRVDLRLRPEGEKGDLAISQPSALEYYEHRAREWELQMLIKARHSAGEERVTREFLRSVEPYIYRTRANFEAVGRVRWAREKVSKKMREGRGSAVDVKRHRGGIRDIEFLTQGLQRLRGGQDPWVRSGGTLLALRKLADKRWLSDADYAGLTSAYEFLRKVEHRIQLDLEPPPHRVPREPSAQDRLARRLGIEGGPEGCPGEVLLRRVEGVFRRVDEIYRRVIHPQVSTPSHVAFQLQPLIAFPSDHDAQSYGALLAFLDAQAPGLATAVRETSLPEKAPRCVTRFFAALLSSSEHFGLAREQPERFRRALEVIKASEYLADLLIGHPEDIAVLDCAPGLAELAPTDPPIQGEIGFDSRQEPGPFAWVAERGLGIGEKMALLRREYWSRAVALGAEDLAGGRCIFSALARWSALARRSISSALEIAREALEVDAPERLSSPSPLMALGLGRLGSSEFDLASDADLVFVVAPDTPREEKAHWTRVAQKTIEVLSSYTRDGTLFAVDTRLRPRGQQGELVVTEETLLDYLGETARLGEALTYLKALPVAGNLQLAHQLVHDLDARLRARFASDRELEAEFPRLGGRREREPSVPPTNPKTTLGGYDDAELAVSFLRLRHRLRIPPGYNLAEQIDKLASARLMSGDDARSLSQSAGFLRSVDHAVRLITGKAAEGLPERVGPAESVESLARRWGLVPDGGSLAQTLLETQSQVRGVCRRIVGAE